MLDKIFPYLIKFINKKTKILIYKIKFIFFLQFIIICFITLDGATHEDQVALHVVDEWLVWKGLYREVAIYHRSLVQRKWDWWSADDRSWNMVMACPTWTNSIIDIEVKETQGILVGGCSCISNNGEICLPNHGGLSCCPILVGS